MSFKSAVLTAAFAAFSLQPALALAPEPARKLDVSSMAGRWYEVARIPNKLQNGCGEGTVQWTRAGDGYAVVQTCRKGPARKEWKARAKVLDPRTNAKFRMSFFGGMMSQEYWVLDTRPEQGWLILGTPGGNYLWLMAQRPALGDAVKAQALTRVRQLGYDVSRLEFPKPALD